MSDDLVERVAQQFSHLDHLNYEYGKQHTWNDYARAAIAACMEEAAKVADGVGQQPPTDNFMHDTGWDGASLVIAAAIRALIPK